MLCPCCSEQSFETCCKPLISCEQMANSAESLMRSRYTAYCQRAIDYIFATYATTARVGLTKQSIAQWANSVTFVRLQILDTQSDNDEGFVEFSAHYFSQNTEKNLKDNVLHKLHEKSRFIREDNQWCYIDGTITDEHSQTIGRNDSCPCLSGKKFKKCHGRSNQ
jgi:SEC-C motif-containing protein